MNEPFDLDGPFFLRRGRGRPKRRGLDDIDLAEDLVRALKMCARANGKVRSIERAAIEIAAQRYEVSEDALYHRMHRAPKKYIYPVHVMTRKSFGLMTRKLSVTESQKSAQFRGTVSRRKPSVASANWAHVA